MENKPKISIVDLNQAQNLIQWCPGCGDFGILAAIKKAIVILQLDPKDVVIVSGIGCSSKLPHYIKTYSIETLHGRTLPVATAIKLANKNLHVIVVGGDGDGYGIGMGHFIHSMRRNVNITYIVLNNGVYALTKGQASPTTKKGEKTSSTPNGTVEEPINPLALSILNGASFVARGYSGDLISLSEIISKGIAHEGFSHIDVLQLCPSYQSKKIMENITSSAQKMPNLAFEDIENRNLALARILDETKNMEIGVFYKVKKENLYDPFSKLNARVEDKIEHIDLAKVKSHFK